MKKYRILIAIGITITASVIHLISKDSCINCSERQPEKAQSSKPSTLIPIENTSKKEKFEKSTTHANLLSKQPELHIDNKEKELKKTISDDWCDAKTELNSKDYNYITAEYKDYKIDMGKAYIKAGDSIYESDYIRPNNDFAASYQELPIDDLALQAQSDDKWAMTTFLQRFSVKYRPAQRKVAKKLLMLGHSYHAVEFLVIDELAAAKTSYQKTNQVDKSTEHIINAIAYTMIGLKDYNESGLIAYLGNISRNKFFLEDLNPKLLLANKQNEVRQRYLTFKNAIEQTRIENSIYVEPPPQKFSQLFTQDLAAVMYRREKLVQFLDELQVTPDVNLYETECIKQHIQNFRSRLD